MTDTAAPAQPSRSTFVTVVAWVFICLSALGTLITLLQNLLLAFVFPLADMQQAMNDPHGPPMPPIAQFMFGHLQLFVGAMLVISALLLAASIGLLRRRDWARKLFIAFMALGIVYNIAGLAFQFAFYADMAPMQIPPNAPPDIAASVGAMMTVMKIVSAAMALTFCVLFGWIIKRLVSEQVRQEFAAAAAR